MPIGGAEWTNTLMKEATVCGVVLQVRKQSYTGYTSLNPWHCGYARFPEDPLPRTSGYDGIAEYVPVHGGITYAECEDGEMVYGFDCAHAGDEHDARFQDVEWLLGECDSMARAIKVAAQFEARFEDADDADKAEIGEEYLACLSRDHGFSYEDGDLSMGYHIRRLFGHDPLT